MAIKIPVRNYLTFVELQERWKCSENDLRYAVISAELKPSVRLMGRYCSLTWDVDPAGELVASEYQPGEFGYAVESDVRGWQYLQDPIQTESFDCEFRLAADDRDPVKEAFSFATWRALPKPISLSHVKDSAVFLLSEIARYEAKYGSESDFQKVEKPQSHRERDTLLIIIAALCKEAKIPYEKHAKAAGLIESTAALMGIPISETAIENYLKKIPEALAARMK